MANQVLIDWDELLELIEDQEFLECLHEAGVSDWEGYNKAINLFKESLDESDPGLFDDESN